MPFDIKLRISFHNKDTKVNKKTPEKRTPAGVEVAN